MTFYMVAASNSSSNLWFDSCGKTWSHHYMA